MEAGFLENHGDVLHIFFTDTGHALAFEQDAKEISLKRSAFCSMYSKISFPSVSSAEVSDCFASVSI